MITKLDICVSAAKHRQHSVARVQRVTVAVLREQPPRLAHHGDRAVHLSVQHVRPCRRVEFSSVLPQEFQPDSLIEHDTSVAQQPEGSGCDV
jgi:hypothetical protein